MGIISWFEDIPLDIRRQIYTHCFVPIKFRVSKRQYLWQDSPLPKAVLADRVQAGKLLLFVSKEFGREAEQSFLQEATFVIPDDYMSIDQQALRLLKPGIRTIMFTGMGFYQQEALDLLENQCQLTSKALRQVSMNGEFIHVNDAGRERFLDFAFKYAQNIFFAMWFLDDEDLPDGFSTAPPRVSPTNYRVSIDRDGKVTILGLLRSEVHNVMRVLLRSELVRQNCNEFLLKHTDPDGEDNEIIRLPQNNQWT